MFQIYYADGLVNLFNISQVNKNKKTS